MKIDFQASDVRFVYPFIFSVEEFDPCVKQLEQAHWEGRGRPLQIWEQLPFPEDELLAYVARYLNAPEGKQPTACLVRLTDDALKSTRGLGGGINSGVQWTLTGRKTEIPFEIMEIQLALFQVGVGFLTITAQPTDGADRVETWLDFVHYFRFARGQRAVGLSARRRTGIDRETREPRTSPFFPEPAGGLAQHPEGQGIFQDVIHMLLGTATPVDKAEVWWDEVFMPGTLLPYLVLFVDGVSDEEIPLLAYRARRFFHAGQELHPSSQDLCLDHEALLPYADRQWFFFSLNGGGFLACNPPTTPFFRETLPDHLHNHYFLLFLLALQQRFALMLLTQEVADKWLIAPGTATDQDSLHAREKAFAQIRDHLLSFTARGFFTQVMQREPHHRCYQQWQKTFDVERLYREVSDEVRYMHSKLEAARDQLAQRADEKRRQQTQRLERRLNLIAWVIGVPALALTFINATGPVELSVALYILLASLATGLLLYLLVTFLTSRGSKGSS